MFGGKDQERPLGELVSRVIDDGKAYARAEVALIKQTVTSKVDAFRPAVILIVVAVFLLQAAITVLAAALGMALSRWLGVAGGLAVGAVLVLALAGALVGIAIGRIKQAL